VRIPPVEVVPYDPEWPAVFGGVRERADAALAGLPHVTEHVGSTAVPGLAAKPIVDVDVVVPESGLVAAAVQALGRAGWRPEGDLGIAGREAFTPPGDGPYHHLYVVVAGSVPHRDHTDLRDFLRSNPAAAARYADRKRELAPLLRTDRAAYTEGKAALIAELLAEARTGG